MLALCFMNLREFSPAKFHAEQSIHLAPDQSFGHSALAQVLIHCGRPDEARLAICEAIRLAPTIADYYGILASLEIDKQQFHAALTTTSHGLSVQPENAICLNMRSLALANVGDAHGTAATRLQVLEISPDHAYTHASQGWALLRLLKVRESLEHFREALRIDPDFEWARQGMAEALRSRNPISRVLGRSNLAPLCNLVLCIDRFGRHLLTTDQVRGAYLTGTCWAVVVACIALAAALQSALFVYLSCCFAMLSLLASGIFQCRAGKHRWIIAAMTTGLLAVALGLPLVLRALTRTAPLGGTLFLAGVSFFLLAVFARLRINRLIVASRRT